MQAEQVVRVAPEVRAVPVAREVPAALAARAGQSLARLADAYANPVMVDALIHSREGTIAVPDIDLLRAGFPGHR